MSYSCPGLQSSDSCWNCDIGGRVVSYCSLIPLSLSRDALTLERQSNTDYIRFCMHVLCAIDYRDGAHEEKFRMRRTDACTRLPLVSAASRGDGERTRSIAGQWRHLPTHFKLENVAVNDVLYCISAIYFLPFGNVWLGSVSVCNAWTAQCRI